MLLYFHIIPAQTIDALYIEQIVFFQFLQQLSILGPVKILTGAPVDVNVSPGKTDGIQRVELPVFLLVFCGNTGISIDHSAS